MKPKKRILVKGKLKLSCTNRLSSTKTIFILFGIIFFANGCAHGAFSARSMGKFAQEIRASITSSFVKESTGNFYQQKGYVISFLAESGVAEYGAYCLNQSQVMTQGQTSRAGLNYIQNYSKWAQNRSEFYKNNDYDHGHIVPAEDMSYSKESLSDSFQMGNMVPQLHTFNSGIWNQIEKFVRSKMPHYDLSCVITGIVKNDLRGEIVSGSHLMVPERFFKIALYFSEDKVESLAFLIDQFHYINGITNHITSIDSKEALTQLDFFPLLRKDIQATVEKESRVYKLRHSLFNLTLESEAKATSVSRSKSVPTKPNSKVWNCQRIEQLSCQSVELSCEVAQWALKTCRMPQLDGDQDGTACDQKCSKR